MSHVWRGSPRSFDENPFLRCILKLEQYRIYLIQADPAGLGYPPATHANLETRTVKWKENLASKVNHHHQRNLSDRFTHPFPYPITSTSPSSRMSYREEDYKPRMPRSESFHPTPNSLLASGQYQQYSDPHRPNHRSSQGYGYGGQSGQRQSHYQQQPQQQYHDDPDDRPLRPLYYEQGEERDETFDVRADFDGKGPRWSEMYGTGKGDPRK